MSDPQEKPQACIIWMHGLGSDAQDMAGLASAISSRAPIRHVFMNAPVRPVTLHNNMSVSAWYDIIELGLTAREDIEGILNAEESIKDVIHQQIKAGFKSEQIFLAGFSQGGAMALFVGLRYEDKLGGIIALSTYLPLAQEPAFNQQKNIPIFFASGKYDMLVIPLWSTKSVEVIRSHGYNNISWHEYPIEHSVSLEEVLDLTQWIDIHVVPEKGDVK